MTINLNFQLNKSLYAKTNQPINIEDFSNSAQEKGEFQEFRIKV